MDEDVVDLTQDLHNTSDAYHHDVSHASQPLQSSDMQTLYLQIELKAAQEHAQGLTAMLVRQTHEHDKSMKLLLQQKLLYEKHSTALWTDLLKAEQIQLAMTDSYCLYRQRTEDVLQDQKLFITKLCDLVNCLDNKLQAKQHEVDVLNVVNVLSLKAQQDQQVKETQLAASASQQDNHLKLPSKKTKLHSTLHSCVPCAKSAKLVTSTTKPKACTFGFWLE